MALLPARRNGTLSRPGPQAPARWDPLLTVTVPKTEASKPHRIQITG